MRRCYGDIVTDTVLAPAVLEQVRGLGPADIVVALIAGAPDATASDEAREQAIRATQVGLAQQFPALRPAVVAILEAAPGVKPLRAGTASASVVERALLVRPATRVQRLDVSVHAAGGGTGWRAALEAAAALDASAAVVLGGDLRSVLPEWIELLAGPILKDRFDLVTPAGGRGRYDDVAGSLLAAPLLRALYGLRIAQPTAGEIGLGRALVRRATAAPGNEAGALWVTADAVAAGARLGQAWLGPTLGSRRIADSSIADGANAGIRALLAAAQSHPDAWMGIRGSAEVPTYGFERGGEGPTARVNPVAWLAAFEAGATAQREAWSRILSPATRKAILDLAVTAAGVGLSARDWLNLDRGADIGRLDTPTLAGAMATFQFPDDVWANAVLETVGASGRADASVDDLAAALLPIFFGRAASFVVEARRASPADLAALLERQALAFERRKPDLVARWPSGNGALADLPSATSSAPRT